MERGRTGEAYNVGSDTTHAMREILDRLVSAARVPIEVRAQTAELRPAETAVACADSGKLRRETGWAPKYTLDQTLADVLDYWRSQTG
jgi:GDP-4-dehydro-6-deoxy-D-mannose reductase